ncbi:DNA excision repair protein ERCC-3 [Fusarium oxysporum f. sp. raphani 54005]|uniref:DNA 3'-5' helicase n=2 Tax=Fusarium oxysporum f. sp. raphani TaxID=96318 RepID=X0C6P9_FUSOX|nr:DNA excision repair protein ERCC-3 [Fusarium oxysporum f. sp. raphani 54005]KAG7428551.1 General transcription and DNA repair factor IIH helicase subunit XPB [Fusarium oxysporum f. sp. raphani]
MPLKRKAQKASIDISSIVKRDFSYLARNPDSDNRPLWIDPDKGYIILERFHPLADLATDFLVTIAEPQSRPAFLHEYKITSHSLYAAVSVGLNGEDIINTLDKFLKTELPQTIRDFIRSCTKSFGKVKLVLKDNKYFVESGDADVLQTLLKDNIIGPLRVNGSGEDITTTRAPALGVLVIPGTKNAAGVQQADLPQTADKESGQIEAVLDDYDKDDEKEAVHAFEIPDSAVETVQKRCLDLSYPILEEYDFRYDNVNPDLDIDLRPNIQIRSYQEKSLSKMFGNGRAKSGIIVLPCGAGKTLVGITAACTIRKGVIVLCTSSVSAVQWRNEFLKWSNINPGDITTFTSDSKERFSGRTGVIVTTYSMVTNSRERAHGSKKMMDFLSGREWGLMLLDEVHVVPANMFRRVVSSIKTHSKLGLTATLLREDDKIDHLNFLIGPKLYEANWMELSQQGHIAKVQCAEVWCSMPTVFYEQYLQVSSRMKRTLAAINPSKFQACQFLINYHEARGDKIIVFSDELYSLKLYAYKLKRYLIYGGTSQEERLRVLDHFRHSPKVNTLFLSKIGDTSLDLPEATCLIQISSQFGSRRQEAQRLGRILRAKRRNDEGFNAFFYSLVSKDTSEMHFASKRQAFLIDQGYAFKVITKLHGIEKTPDLAFCTAVEQRELLQGTLVDNETAVDDDCEADDLWGGDGKKSNGSGTKGKVKRVAGYLDQLSGVQDMAYIERDTSANKGLKRKKGEKNEFFKKVDRENKRRKNT